MANKAEHDLIGVLTGIGCTFLNQDDETKFVINPIIGIIIGLGASRLPDIWEPPINPYHRAFFHSWTFLGLLCVGMYKTWNLETNDLHEKILKWVLLIGGAAYASHLIRDSVTKKSLPLI